MDAQAVQTIDDATGALVRQRQLREANVSAQPAGVALQALMPRSQQLRA